MLAPTKLALAPESAAHGITVSQMVIVPSSMTQSDLSTVVTGFAIPFLGADVGVFLR